MKAVSAELSVVMGSKSNHTDVKCVVSRDSQAILKT